MTQRPMARRVGRHHAREAIRRPVPGRRLRHGVGARLLHGADVQQHPHDARAQPATGTEVTYEPPCMFRWQFFIENIQGHMKLSGFTTAARRSRLNGTENARMRPAVKTGLGRTLAQSPTLAALHHRSGSILYQIHEHIR